MMVQTVHGEKLCKTSTKHMMAWRWPTLARQITLFCPRPLAFFYSISHSSEWKSLCQIKNRVQHVSGGYGMQDTSSASFQLWVIMRVFLAILIHGVVDYFDHYLSSSVIRAWTRFRHLHSGTPQYWHWVGRIDVRRFQGSFSSSGILLRWRNTKF